MEAIISGVIGGLAFGLGYWRGRVDTRAAFLAAVRKIRKESAS